MVIEVRLPQFGMGMQDATVLSWYCKEGDRITIDAPLLEVESAKTTVEVPSPATGVLKRILVQPGVNVPVLAVLAEIDAATAVAALPDPQRSSEAPPQAAAADAPRATPLAARLALEHGVDLAAVPPSGYGGRINAADVRSALPVAVPGAKATAALDRRQVEPRARKLAHDAGLQLSEVAGSGPDGRVVEADVRAALQAREATAPLQNAIPAPSPTAPPLPPTVGVVAAAQRRGMREVIAHRMMQSLQGSAQLTLTSEVDITALVRLRDYLQQEFDVGYTCLFVKACALALQRCPEINASWTDQGVRRHTDAHIGVAVALEEGLLVPVLRHVQSKPLRQLASEFTRLVGQARNGSAGLADLSGGTFSVSNLGAWGIDAFTPVLNPPEAGILGLGRIQERLVREGDGMAWRKTMVLSLTFDHRVLDGVPAARFLQTVADIMRQPEALLA